MGGVCSPILDVLSAAGLKSIIYTNPQDKLTRFRPHRCGQPANPPASPAPTAAGICTHLSSYLPALTEYSGQRYRRWRQLKVFQPSPAPEHAHFCHEHAAAQQPGQDPRNTHNIAPQAGAARLGPAAAACRSLLARRRQKLQGRTNMEAARQSGHGSPGTRGHTSSSERV